MRKLMLLCAWLCAMGFVVTVSGRPAHAVGNNVFSYVSHTGSDLANCNTPATACATLNRALNETANNGEIDCVDAGNYYDGPLGIQQLVTIDCAGGVCSTSGNILINAPGGFVRLRNLTLNNNGRGLVGIDAENMAALYVENCVITNYNPYSIGASTPYIGIYFVPSASAQLFVSNSLLSYNGSSGASGGIYIKPASGMTATVSIDHSQIVDNYFGIYGDGAAGGIIKGTISDSVVTGTTEDGIVALSSEPSVWLFIDRTKVAVNAYGLAAGGSGAEILANNTSVFGNTTGLHTSKGGALYSYGNNRINGNTTNGAFTGMIGLQ
jgi:hypothetical protein